MIPIAAGSAAAAAFIAGLAGSPHCLGMCGGLSMAASREASGAVAWNLGRLTTYATLGVLAAQLGRSFPGPAWVAQLLAGLLLVAFAAGLSGLLPPLHVTIPGIAPFASRLIGRTGIPARFLLGLVSGLLPCGLVYAALAVPVALQDPFRGALAMLAFGLGTVPALAVAAAGFRRLLQRGPWVRRGIAAVVLIAGFYAIFARRPTEDAVPACHRKASVHATMIAP